MSTPEAITNQQELLNAHRKVLHHLLVEAANLRGGYTPPHLRIDTAKVRADIRYIKTTLREWGVEVEDLPEDNPDEETSESYRRPSMYRIWWRLAITSGVIIGSIFVVWYEGVLFGQQQGGQSTDTTSVAPAQFGSATSDQAQLRGTTRAQSIQATLVAQPTIIVEAVQATLTALPTPLSTPTATPTTEPIFFDDFGGRRPPENTYVMNAARVHIIPGRLDTTASSPFCCPQKIYTVLNTFKDFEMYIDIASIEGKNIRFSTYFRVDNDGWTKDMGYRFDININDNTFGFNNLFNGEALPIDVVGNSLSIETLTQLHIVCEQGTCIFWVNAQSNPVYITGRLLRLEGMIGLATSGEGQIRIRDIYIKQFNGTLSPYNVTPRSLPSPMPTLQRSPHQLIPQ